MSTALAETGCEIWNEDMSAKIADVDDWVDLSWQQSLNDPGAGTLVIDSHNAALASCTHRRIVRCTLRVAEYVNPLYVFAFTIDSRVFDLAGNQTEEEAGQLVTLSGRGLLAMAETVSVDPPGGLDAVPLADHRLFTFASPDWTPIGWAAPTEVKKQDDPTTYWPLPDATNAPQAWPDVDAYWIWPGGSDYEPAGRAWFRSTLTLADSTLVEIYASGDNLWTLYVNGVPFLGDDVNSLAWQETRFAAIRLPAGDHVIAAVVENQSATGAINPGGLIVSVYEKNPDDGTLGTVLLRSNAADWLSYEEAVDGVPGWTAGQIMETLINEGIARDVQWQPTLLFDAVGDALSEPWPVIPEVVVPIGASVWDALAILIGNGHIDVANVPPYLDPVALELYAPGTWTWDFTLTLTPGDNVTSLTWQE